MKKLHLLDVSSDQGLSRGQIGGLLAKRLEDVSFTLSILFAALYYDKNVALTFIIYSS
jgi:hypothetical protein